MIPYIDFSDETSFKRRSYFLFNMLKSTGMINSLEYIELSDSYSFDYNLLMSLIIDYKKTNSQSYWNIKMEIYEYNSYELKCRIFEFFKKVDNKKSQLVKCEIEGYNLELLEIWSAVPFQVDDFNKDDL